jgi:hypothetical protein
MASSLAQIVKYEFPNERKTMEKSQRALADVERLEEVVDEEIVSLTKQYERQCGELGIRPTGKDPVPELEGLGAKMTPWCDRIVEAVQAPSVKRAIEYHDAFAKYVAGLTGCAVDKICGQFSVLHVLMNRGNVLRSEVTLTSVAPQKKKSDEEWEIEEVSEREDTVLSAADSRAECLDSLFELSAFLQARMREKIAAEPALLGLQDSLVLSADCPEPVRASDNLEQLTALRDGVVAVLAVLEATQFVRLVEMSSSRAYAERMAASVRKRLDLIDGARERRLQIKGRREALKNEIANTRERQASLAERQKRLTLMLQDEIGKKFSRVCKIE